MCELSLLCDVAGESEGWGSSSVEFAREAVWFRDPDIVNVIPIAVPKVPSGLFTLLKFIFICCSGEFHGFVSQLLNTFLYLPRLRPPSSGFQVCGPSVLSVSSQNVCLSFHWWRLPPHPDPPQTELSRDPRRRSSDEVGWLPVSGAALRRCYLHAEPPAQAAHP